MRIAKMLTIAGGIAFVFLTVRSVLAADPLGAAVALQGLPPATATKFVEVAATADTLNLLRNGGYALYLRHGLCKMEPSYRCGLLLTRHR
jgi:hypothetical protein